MRNDWKVVLRTGTRICSNTIPVQIQFLIPAPAEPEFVLAKMYDCDWLKVSANRKRGGGVSRKKVKDDEEIRKQRKCRGSNYND